MPDSHSADLLQSILSRPLPAKKGKKQVTLLGSGAILNEAVKARDVLHAKFGVNAEVWSLTSYKQLQRDALEAERWNLRHPAEAPRTPYVTECLSGGSGPVIAASDYMKTLPDALARFIPRTFVTLGTDGYGRSDGRDGLRVFFEVDAAHIAATALSALVRDGVITAAEAAEGHRELGLDPEKPDPWSR